MRAATAARAMTPPVSAFTLDPAPRVVEPQGSIPRQPSASQELRSTALYCRIALFVQSTCALLLATSLSYRSITAAGARPLGYCLSMRRTAARRAFKTASRRVTRSLAASTRSSTAYEQLYVRPSAPRAVTVGSAVAVGVVDGVASARCAASSRPCSAATAEAGAASSARGVVSLDDPARAPTAPITATAASASRARACRTTNPPARRRRSSSARKAGRAPFGSASGLTSAPHLRQYRSSVLASWPQEEQNRLKSPPPHCGGRCSCDPGVPDPHDRRPPHSLGTLSSTPCIAIATARRLIRTAPQSR